jgi:hypothetical protein
MLPLTIGLYSGANPTIVSYNTVVVKIYIAMSSPVRFFTKIFSSSL